MKLTELAIKRPAFMTMIFLALAVFGLFSYFKIGVDLLPKMDWPMVIVSTVYPGAGPEEVESQISKPIEEALSSLNSLKSIRSYSVEGASITFMEFEMSKDVNVALNDVERKMSQVKGTLPEDAKEPEIAKADMNNLPIIRLAALSNMDNQAFYQYLKDEVKPKLEQVEGISTVEIVGGKQREIRVEVDNEKLKYYNITLQQVAQALSLENLNYPTGSVEQKERKFIVRVAGKFKALDEIKNLVLVSTPNNKICLRDVANVMDTNSENFSLSRFNQDNCIGLIISKASDANAVKTSKKIMKALSKIEDNNKSINLKFIVAQNTTTFTEKAIKSVKFDMILAIIMVAFVLIIFLHNFKNSLIVLLSIPISLVTTFIMMNLLGFTINLITMMALTLVIGILVDDSIVVLENIHRKLESGENQVNAAIKGRSEIGMAAIAITLVDVVVFLPISMISGIVGKIFREFGLTIVTATLVSLFVSFTLTPLLASRWSKLTNFKKKTIFSRFAEWFDRMESGFREAYRSILRSALYKPWFIIGVTLIIFIASFYLPAKVIGQDFMPRSDRGEFAINLEFPQGTGLKDNDMITTRIENFIKQDKNVDSYYTVVGRKEEAWGGINRTDISQIQVKMVDLEKRTISSNDFMNKVSNEISSIPGVKANIALISMFGAGDEKPIMIEIKGDNLNSIINVSEKVQKIVENTPGTRDVSSSWEAGQPELQVKINRERCAYYQTTVGEVAEVLQFALQGDNSTKYKSGETEYDINVILDKKFRQSSENVSRILITNHLGQQIQVSQVADIFYGKGPNQISRKDRSRIISISANFDAAIPLNTITKHINAEIKKESIPKDVTVFFGGEAESMGDMFVDMMIAITFAFLFVYMIMVSLYESYVYPFIIMFSIPVAMVGAFLGLALTGQTLNVFSMIGIIMSMGLVTKNAILVVDYTNTLRKSGKDMFSALLEAAPTRLRPIMMTTLTMVFGMLPIAMSHGSGGDMRKGMAIVVIGALISSTVLTLVLVPVVYTIVEKIRFKITGKDQFKDLL